MYCFMLLIFASVLRLASCHWGSTTNYEPTAITKNGTVRGLYLNSFDQDIFLGIPFAEAPRLANPQPVSSTWTNGFDATTFATTCYGSGSNQALNLTQGEDCLNLNIVRPHGTYDGLSVLVWIYGGGFSQGSIADPMWNTSYIVQTSVENDQPIMVVSINYRLSFLGFPVGNTSFEAGISNLGLKDQRLALQWVQENIAAFGGDPQKVTVWGESAGGCSVGMHLISYGGTGSQGLFRGAIMSSGTIQGTCNPKMSYKMDSEYQQIVAHANCSNTTDTLQCLRETPIDALYPFELEVHNLGLVIDGEFVRKEPILELDQGNVHRVPALVGANSDEGLFVVNLLGNTPTNETGLHAFIASLLPGLDSSTIDDLLETYAMGDPAPPYSLPADYPFCAAMKAANLSCTPQYRRAAAIFGDYFADAGRRYMAEKWSQLGLPTYSYRFAANPMSVPISFWTGLGAGFANHGTDLAYDFRLPGGFTTPIHYYPPVKPVASHEYLSRVMASKFISFTYSLDPNSLVLPGTPQWPVYGESRSNYVFDASDIAIDVHCEPDTYRQRGIDIWKNHALEAWYGLPRPRRHTSRFLGLLRMLWFEQPGLIV